MDPHEDNHHESEMHQETTPPQSNASMNPLLVVAPKEEKEEEKEEESQPQQQQVGDGYPNQSETLGQEQRLKREKSSKKKKKKAKTKKLELEEEEGGTARGEPSSKDRMKPMPNAPTENHDNRNPWNTTVQSPGGSSSNTTNSAVEEEDHGSPPVTSPTRSTTTNVRPSTTTVSRPGAFAQPGIGRRRSTRTEDDESSHGIMNASLVWFTRSPATHDTDNNTDTRPHTTTTTTTTTTATLESDDDEARTLETGGSYSAETPPPATTTNGVTVLPSTLMNEDKNHEKKNGSSKRRRSSGPWISRPWRIGILVTAVLVMFVVVAIAIYYAVSAAVQDDNDTTPQTLIPRPNFTLPDPALFESYDSLSFFLVQWGSMFPQCQVSKPPTLELQCHSGTNDAFAAGSSSPSLVQLMAQVDQSGVVWVECQRKEEDVSSIVLCQPNSNNYKLMNNILDLALIVVCATPGDADVSLKATVSSLEGSVKL